MARRPTIFDVAAHAGVSKSTVSLVLQNSPQVRAETRDKVRAAMARIGYVYNRNAAQMRSAAAGMVGLVINDLRNPFFAEFATVLQMTLAAKGYATVIANSDEDAALEAKLIGSMIEHGVAGLVVSPAYGAEGGLDKIDRAELPVLQVLRKTERRGDAIPFASFDYATGSALATRHLLDHGARRIAFVGGIAARAVTQERISGYLAQMQSAGLKPLALHGPTSRAFGIEAADLLQDTHPDIDAVLCFNDLIALGLHAGCARLGRRVGRDIRIVGFDDIQECAQVWPQLSSVSCDIAGFARASADRLLAWMQDGTPPPSEHRAPVTLIARMSSLGETP